MENLTNVNNGEQKEVIGVLNTSILTTVGTYELRELSLEDAREIANSCVLDSAVGHQATADIMTELLNVNVPFNRQIFRQEVGQRCIVFKIRGRIPEGVILTIKELSDIGYDLQLLTRTN